MNTSVPSFETAIIAALAVLFGAALGSFSTFSVTRKSFKKDVSIKMAEYRLQWINDLGDEFAKFSSVSINFMILGKSDDKKRRNEMFAEQHRCLAKVRLLMNINDKDYANVIDKMTNIINISGDEYESAEERDELFINMKRSEEEFIAVCNSVLKREWRKLKKNLREDTVEVAALRSDADIEQWSYYLHGTVK